MRRKLIAGNWKMHGVSSALVELEVMAASASGSDVDLVICPPSTLLDRARDAISQRPIELGGQDCHSQEKGAHTGDISADMLVDAGASWVILGHSERRINHGEKSEEIAEKCAAALRSGLKVMLCVGETLAEREAGREHEVIERQLAQSMPEKMSADQLAIAYEPVWAIGTGLRAEASQISDMHGHIRSLVAERFGATFGATLRVLYGGSVKPDNAEELLSLPDVDGALIGGASLKAADFLAIAMAAAVS